MHDFCRRFEISEYKVIGQTSYVIINTTNGLILVQFDLQGNYVAKQQIEFSPIHCENNINNIQIGMSLDDVRLADPTKKYDFLLHSSSKYPQISYHFFEDGKVYYIYFENYIVKNIVVFTI